MKLTVTSEQGAVAGELVREAVARLVAERGRCVLGLAGGSSPLPVFRWFVANPLPEGVVVTWIDERHSGARPADWRELPPTSNERGAFEAWLQHVHLPTYSMHHAGTLDEAVAAHEVQQPDVVLMGIGGDGHLASLFPGHSGLTATEPVIGIADSPKPPAERLTLTMGVLEAASLVVLVAAGEGKADALSRAAAGDESLPIGRFRPQHDYHWVLDEPAASKISGSMK